MKVKWLIVILVGCFAFAYIALYPLPAQPTTELDDREIMQVIFATEQGFDRYRVFDNGSAIYEPGNNNLSFQTNISQDLMNQIKDMIRNKSYAPEVHSMLYWVAISRGHSIEYLIKDGQKTIRIIDKDLIGGLVFSEISNDWLKFNIQKAGFEVH